MDICPKCSSGLTQYHNSNEIECLCCNCKWYKKYIINCSCGNELNTKTTNSLRIIKDGKTGWFSCPACGKYINISREKNINEIINLTPK